VNLKRTGKRDQRLDANIALAPFNAANTIYQQERIDANFDSFM
jgi:hypothetical protein